MVLSLLLISKVFASFCAKAPREGLGKVAPCPSPLFPQMITKKVVRDKLKSINDRMGSYSDKSEVSTVSP